MTNGAAVGAAVGAVAYAAMTNAIKASGAITSVEPQQFLNILEKVEKPIVVHSPSGVFTKYKYLTSYKGFIFFAQSKDPLLIPASVELITAKKIWTPQT